MSDMSRKSLVTDFKSSLRDAADKFNAAADADFIRLLDIAALAMCEVRTLVKRSSVTLEADVIDYPAPANIIRVTRTMWGRNERRARKPYDSGYPQYLPNLCLIETDTGFGLELSRPVTAIELADIGAQCDYFYSRKHSIADAAADTTIKAADRDLLILRAQAEAAKELAFRNVGKPVSMRDGVSNTPRNGTPAALAESLLNEWRMRASVVY
jgi:hypothetical protein